VADDRSEEALVPILVDGSGRDGTTLAMQLLGTAPEVAFDRISPFEQRYLSYLLHWSRLPTRHGWDEASWNLDSLANVEELEGVGVAGPLPWHERSLISGGRREFSLDVFDAAWAAFSARARAAVRARLGDPTLDVRYYAQKNAASWAMPFERLPQMRLLCLLRDPRDTWLSSLAFHHRRAADGGTFLRIGPDRSEEDALAQFIDDQRVRLRWLPTAEKELGAFILRYDSLVGDLTGEGQRLGDWLDLRLDGEAVLRRRGEFAAHITAGSAAQSVGRWREEMSPDLAARFRRAMGEELSQFGFEP
jgi:hypothetical protein